MKEAVIYHPVFWGNGAGLAVPRNAFVTESTTKHLHRKLSPLESYSVIFHGRAQYWLLQVKSKIVLESFSCVLQTIYVNKEQED